MGINIGYPTPQTAPIPTPRPGGLGNLGGIAQPQQPSFLQSDNFGNILQALGISLMGSPRNAPLSGFGQALQGFQQASAQRRDTAEQRSAFEQALIQSGMSPEEARRMSANPQAAKFALEQQQDKQERSASYQFFQKNAPEFAQLVDAGLPVKDVWSMYVKSRQDGDGGVERGLTPQYGVDANGNPVLIQLGKDGTAIQTAMPEGVTLSKEPIKLDAGTHFVLLDPITRQPVGTIPKENYQEAFDTASGGSAGKAQAEAAANLPTDLATAEQAIIELDELINHPGLSAIAGPMDQYRPSWAMGAEGRDALARFNQAKGRAFLQAFGMLKGGGQITEVEGLKAEQAMARMDRAQSEAEFKRALEDFRDAVKTGMDKMRQRAGARADVAPASPPAVNYKDRYGLE